MNMSKDDSLEKGNLNYIYNILHKYNLSKIYFNKLYYNEVK